MAAAWMLAGERIAHELMRIARILESGDDAAARIGRARLEAGGQAANVAQALSTGLATGRNPRETARIIRNAVRPPPSDPVSEGGRGDGQQPSLDAVLGHARKVKVRSERIARTETMRAYRSASLESYTENQGLLEGWRWVAALDLRTCPACWAMHGTVHPLAEPFGGHVNCRCVPAPIVPGYEEDPQEPTGVQTFERLSEADQRAVLGPKKLDLYKTGRIRLPDLVDVSYHPSWGFQQTEGGVARALANRRYVIAPNGTLAFGRVGDDIVWKADLTPPRQPGIISMELRSNDSMGALHIEKRLGQLRQNGFDTVDEFVAYVASHYAEVRRADYGRLMIVARLNSHANLLVLEWLPSERRYTVITGGVFRESYTNATSRELLGMR